MLSPLPEPVDKSCADRHMAEFEEKLPDLADDQRQFLYGVFGASPFLAGLLQKYPQCLNEPPEAQLQEIEKNLLKLAFDCDSEAELKAAIRKARSRAALIIALADLSGKWDVETVTGWLTNIADAAINAATNWLLLDAERKHKVHNINRDDPAIGCGYTILAMGKHGAGELNFSSDVDLIILFDPENNIVADGVEPSMFFVRMTRRLAAILQDVTGDGYAYRVDLRLRPDPGATQLAISVNAALVYYESMGQNWERAAMIKARPAAGDLKLGHEFLQMIKPFIWRKYLDFAAINEVHSLKRKIHAHKGHGQVKVLGHNVKLGRGGIREIEFFVQTQQLIAGGRNEDLRGRRTLPMLQHLVKAGWVTADVAARLETAYNFLRQIEHRIQMIADQQTHELPSDSQQFSALARFCGYGDDASFTSALQSTFETVEELYDSLFASDPGQKVILDFTGIDDNAETLAYLEELGFARPEMICQSIRRWYTGHFKALRTNEARERLKEILPALLDELAATGEPDNAFAAFERFLSGLPAGVQLFSMLRANSDLLSLLTKILGDAPRLADELARRPRMLEAVIDPEFFSSLPDAEQLAEIFARTIPLSLPFEEILDQARIIGREMSFRIGVRILSQTIHAHEAGKAYADLASALVAHMLKASQLDIARLHGSVKSGQMAIIAMGKMGGGEMTATSDLDMIIVYDHDPDAGFSDGKKPLSASQYYGRITKRLITALTTPTAEGVLYEVDMRLRPSGNKGPIAIHIDGFVDYQKNDAWTWERMALTRARLIAGDQKLCDLTRDAIRTALCTSRDAAGICKDALDMRNLLDQEKPAANIWDLKTMRGGIIDVEFITQVMQLLSAPEKPDVLDVSVINAIDKLAAGNVIEAETASQLKFAANLYQSLSQIIKLGVAGPFDAQNAPAKMITILCIAAGCPDMASTTQLLEDTAGQVRHIFKQVIG